MLRLSSNLNQRDRRHKNRVLIKCPFCRNYHMPFPKLSFEANNISLIYNEIYLKNCLPTENDNRKTKSGLLINQKN